jgi:hypothetical protein
MDVDALEATFYKDGCIVGRCSPSTTSTWESHPAGAALKLGVGISGGGGRVRLVPPSEMAFEEGARFSTGSSGASGPWVTVEALSAKAMALCEDASVQAAAGMPVTAPMSKVRPAVTRPMLDSVMANVGFCDDQCWIL